MKTKLVFENKKKYFWGVGGLNFNFFEKIVVCVVSRILVVEKYKYDTQFFLKVTEVFLEGRGAFFFEKQGLGGHRI